MDTAKIGQLIRQLRREKGLTQLQLAEQMHISDKTVSKWERGLGCPELSLLPALSEIFAVDLERLLSGALDAKQILGGNMKKTRFYICPHCGNLISAMAEAGIACCGKKLLALRPQKAPEDARLQVEESDNELFISSTHPMERAHYVSFLALLTGDGLLLRKLYPEWDLQARLPIAHGRLLWYCTQHGLFYQDI